MRYTYSAVTFVGDVITHRPLFTTNLSHLHFYVSSRDKLGDKLLDLFRSCPLLKAVLTDDDSNAEVGFVTDGASTKVVPLSPRYFRLSIHQLLAHEDNFGPFDWLSLLSACNVAPVINTWELSWLELWQILTGRIMAPHSRKLGDRPGT